MPCNVLYGNLFRIEPLISTFVTDVLANDSDSPRLPWPGCRVNVEVRMFAKSQKDQFDRPTPEPLAKRKQRQAIEGSEAMRDYKHTQDAARDRLRVLRGERLAREAKQKQA